MRLSIKGSGKDIAYYVVDSARDGDKIQTWTVEKIGKHSELLKEHPDPEEYARRYVEKLNDERRADRISFKQTVDFRERLSGDGRSSDTLACNIGWLYIGRLFEMAGLPSFLESIKGRAHYSLSDAVLLLTVGRILAPASVKRTHEKADAFLGMPQMSLDSLYRALIKLQERDAEFQKQLYDGLSSFITRDESVIYYDCTNFYTEAEDEDPDLLGPDGDPILYGMRKYGASKEHRPNPIVQMGLFIDSNGMPISYNLFHGNRNEQEGLVEEEQKMIDLHRQSSFIYCADGGLNSYECRLFNSIGKRGYVVTQSLKKKSDDEMRLLMKDLNWHFLDNDEDVRFVDFRSIVEKYADGEELTPDEKRMLRRDIIYKEFPTTFNVDLTPIIPNIVTKKDRPKLQETIYLTFSAKCFLYQRGIFTRQLARAEDWVERGQARGKNPNSPERLIEETDVTDDGEIAENRTLSIDEKRVESEKNLHGFYAVASNLDLGMRDIMEINKRRWMIEMSFRTMKGVLEARPFYKSTAEGIRGHFAICYAALTLLRAIELRVSESEKDDVRLTEEDIINTLKNMEVVREERPDRYMAIYTGSKALERLEEIFDLGLDRKYYKPSMLERLSKRKPM